MLSLRTAVELDSDAVSNFGDGDMPADPGPRDVVDIHVTPAIREGLLSLDEIDLVPIFKRKACIMKAPPTFLKGAYRSAMRLALSEAEAGHRAGDEARISRAWQLFLLLPRILLHRPPRGEDPQGEVVGAVHRVFPRPMDSVVDHQFGLCRSSDGLTKQATAHTARFCGTAS